MATLYDLPYSSEAEVAYGSQAMGSEGMEILADAWLPFWEILGGAQCP